MYYEAAYGTTLCMYFILYTHDIFTGMIRLYNYRYLILLSAALQCVDKSQINWIAFSTLKMHEICYKCQGSLIPKSLCCLYQIL